MTRRGGADLDYGASVRWVITATLSIAAGARMVFATFLLTLFATAGDRASGGAA